MKFKEFISPENLIILFLAVIYVAIHLLVANNLEYHRDELLYFALGQHPAFGYASVPPLIGWIAWLMEHIAGYSVLAVRLFPAILGGLLVVLIARIAKELGGSFYARILASVGLFVSIFALRTFELFQPVHIDLFLWTLIIYLVLRYINSGNAKYLIYLGIAAGFAFLNKYLIGILFIFNCSSIYRIQADI
jgi:4-amino-4-deoxy-L-arabinose transferase-like glycosyltransferase